MSTPLEDHQRNKKKLVTPFNHSLGDLVELTSIWYPHRIADYLWLCAVFFSSSRNQAMGAFNDIVPALMKQRSKKSLWPKIALPLSHQHLATMSFNQAELILGPLTKKTEVCDNLLSLLVIPKFPGRAKILKFVDLNNFEENRSRHEERFREIVAYAASQDSKPATDIAWLIQAIGIISGKVKVMEHLAESTVEKLNSYPLEEDHNIYGGMFRAFRNSFMSKSMRTDISDAWANRFWSWASKSTECTFDRLAFPKDWNVKYQHFYSELLNELYSSTEQLVEAETPVEMDDFQRTRYEVLSARFYHMVDLTISLVMNGSVLNSSLMSSLRTIFEIVVTSRQLESDGSYFDFIEYGRGKLKLIANKPGSKDLLESLFLTNADFFANEEVNERFTDINLGSFFNKSLRELSINNGMKDAYDKIVDLTSVFVHSEWPALRLRYLSTCTNPLHRYHRIGTFNNFPADALIPILIQLFNTFVEDFSDLGVAPIDISLAVRTS